MNRILVIDEHKENQEKTKEALGDRLEIIMCSHLSQARQLLSSQKVDLVLLDTDYSEGDGFEFCSELRSRDELEDLPILFLTHRNLMSDKVRGFSVGADDYMIQPCEPLELCARVDARLRKAHKLREKEQLIQRGDLTLSIPFQKAVLLDAGVEKDLRLTPTEFRLLYFFIKNEGVVLSRDQLLSTIWSDDVHVLTRTIDKHISTLKKKLGQRATLIQSVHSRGYRFTPSTSTSADEVIHESIGSDLTVV